MAAYSERPMNFELSLKIVNGPIVFQTTHHGGRKHLNMLLQDCHQNNLLTHTGVGLMPFTASTATTEADVTARAQTAPIGANRFSHPYLTGGPEADEIKSAVNNKRTPIGNFFQIANPALSSKAPPGRVYNAHATNTNHLLAMKSTADAGLSSTGLASSGATAAFAAATAAESADPSRWTTSYRTGDRKGGALVARLVNSARTPSGGFYDRRAQIR